MGETAVYNAINWTFSQQSGQVNQPPATLSICYQINSTASDASLSEFMCPSDPQAGHGVYGGDPEDSNNYSASCGTTTYLTSSNVNITSFASFPTTGVFGWQNCKSIAAILDGTSNTVAYAENVISSGNLQAAQKFIGIQNVTAIPLTAIVYDASSIPAITISSIQSCNAAWQSGTGGVQFDAQRGCRMGPRGLQLEHVHDARRAQLAPVPVDLLQLLSELGVRHVL